jgi:ketosteroid isomerase-like protein
MDWAASQFRDGTFEQKEISVAVGTDLAHTVTIERNEVRIAGNAEPSVLELRVTQVLRREPDGWHMVHRHADPLVNKQAPE